MGCARRSARPCRSRSRVLKRDPPSADEAVLGWDDAVSTTLSVVPDTVLDMELAAYASVADVVVGICALHAATVETVGSHPGAQLADELREIARARAALDALGAARLRTTQLAPAGYGFGRRRAREPLPPCTLWTATPARQCPCRSTSRELSVSGSLTTSAPRRFPVGRGRHPRPAGPTRRHEGLQRMPGSVAGRSAPHRRPDRSLRRLEQADRSSTSSSGLRRARAESASRQSGLASRTQQMALT